MNKKIDYYIFIDYSENLIGYNIIKKSNIQEILCRTSKLKHYKKLKHKREYLNAMKKLFQKNKIDKLLVKKKILKLSNNLDIFIEVLEFIKKHPECIIFVSIDDRQYRKFKKMKGLLDGERTKIIRESDLKKDSIEYRLSLIIDTELNLKRRREK